MKRKIALFRDREEEDANTHESTVERNCTRVLHGIGSLADRSSQSYGVCEITHAELVTSLAIKHDEKNTANFAFFGANKTQKLPCEFKRKNCGRLKNLYHSHATLPRKPSCECFTKANHKT